MTYQPNRRDFLKLMGGGSVGLLMTETASSASEVHLPFAYGERELVAFPQKKPLIVQTTRPPQLETPFRYFDKQLITPNDEFFVRYHLAGIPTEIDLSTYRLKISGNVSNPLELSYHDLKTKFKSKKIIAVNQCSGNGRGLANPRINGGGQLGNGAMGNAVWVGVPLRDILSVAKVGKNAKQVTFNGLDQPVITSDADFVKSLDIEHATDGEVLVAYQMNGTDIPFLNGFPVKLVVPGYYGTYWVKHLAEINVIDQEFKGYWMQSAYRVPDNDCHCEPVGVKPDKTVPISKLSIRSFITNFENGSTVVVGQPTAVRGFAFDCGNGIEKVLFSQDDGHTWQPTKLGKMIGKYAFREWSTDFVPQRAGTLQLRVRAFGATGEKQPMSQTWNPGGYMRNVAETVTVGARKES